MCDSDGEHDSWGRTRWQRWEVTAGTLVGRFRNWGWVERGVAGIRLGVRGFYRREILGEPTVSTAGCELQGGDAECLAWH